jgi:hypothetical protein
MTVQLLPDFLLLPSCSATTASAAGAGTRSATGRCPRTGAVGGSPAGGSPGCSAARAAAGPAG